MGGTLRGVAERGNRAGGDGGRGTGRSIWWYVGAAVVAFKLFKLFGLFTDDDEDDDQRHEVVPVTVPAPTTTLSLPPTTDRVVALPAPAVEPVLLVVGEGAGEIGPGLYTHVTEGACSWERRDAFGQRVLETRRGPRLLVQMAPDEQLFSQGCGAWYLYAPPGEPVATVGDGDWLVGSDMPVGRYRSAPAGAADRCEWELATGFLHHDDEVVAHGFVQDAMEVELRAGHRFTSTGCGRWTLVD